MLKEILNNLRKPKDVIRVSEIKTNISSVVDKYKTKIEKADNIQEKMLWNRKLEALGEVTDALGINRKEVGL